MDLLDAVLTNTHCGWLDATYGLMSAFVFLLSRKWLNISYFLGFVAFIAITMSWNFYPYVTNYGGALISIGETLGNIALAVVHFALGIIAIYLYSRK